MVRDIPVCFVGTLNPTWNPERVALLASLRERIPIEVRTGSYVGTFNRSQIALNQSCSNDLNFRTFQAMACGALLLTERIGNGLTDLFQEGHHYVGYERGNLEEIVAAVDYYRRRPAERTAIAEAGYRRGREARTSRHRAERLLQQLRRHDLSSMIASRRARMVDIQASLGMVYEAAWKRCIRVAMRCPPGSASLERYRRIGRRYGALAAKIRGDLSSLLERAS
ncbi:hypothetical protein YTPLAS18_27940 [Nitrospira sp.]|nr:hypothetical protein YTPLAS18_27940 [Nitrospira sp.]